MRQKRFMDVPRCLAKMEVDKESDLGKIRKNQPTPELLHVDWSNKLKFKEYLKIDMDPPTDSPMYSPSV